MSWNPIRFLCGKLADGARRVMMDLGLGGLIEKFEQYFGKYVTFALLLLVGLAAASVCADIIVTFTIKPTIDFMQQALSTQFFGAKFFLYWGISLSSLFLLISIGITIVLNVASYILGFRVKQQIGSIEVTSNNLLECVDISLKKMMSIAETTKNKGLRDDLNKTVAEIHEKLAATRSEGE